MGVISFLYKLLFNKEKHESENNSLELFHSDKYLRPDHTNYRQCPNCHIEASTNKEIIDKFGTRKVNGKIQLQSWCKECRKSNDLNTSDKENNQGKIDIS